MGWGFHWRALKWLFYSGRVAFYYRNAGSLKTERWLFSSGLRTIALLQEGPTTGKSVFYSNTVRLASDHFAQSRRIHLNCV